MMIALFSVMGMFLIFGMDIRKKRGMTPFVDGFYVGLMKLSCAALLLLYAYSILQIEDNGMVEWTSLLLTTIGAVLVAIAKLNLRDSFSWTGHFLKETKLITDGIYRAIRNPLYTGVFIFEAGAVLNYTFNGVLNSAFPVTLALAGTVPLIYAVSFNMTMAIKESRQLELQFGDEYRKYKARTGMFFPKVFSSAGRESNAS